jgi:signal transduction histidine kinase
VETAQDRTRALVEAGIALSSELSLDAVLQTLVETAAVLAGARYAALGVLDPSGQRLERFLTTGVDAETYAAIGDVPTGRGILGVLIGGKAPVRLHDLSEDPRSVGFPPGHPPMRTFLGVPLTLRGVAYGNLYLTEKHGGADFTEEDEASVAMLAAQAAVAIENARLYEAATRWSAQLESLNEVMAVLITQFDLKKLLQIVAGHLRDLIDARGVTIALPNGDGRMRIEAAAGTNIEAHVGTILPARSKTVRVLERERSERVDSVLDDPEVDQESARRLEMSTALYVPIVVHGKAIGVIGAHDKVGSDPRFTHEDLRLAETFAARAAIAFDLSQRVAREALQRVVTAQELERRRLARELHDETGQALTSILLGLRGVEEAGNEEELRTAVSGVRDLVRSTLQDVRQLAVELRPKALDDFGLVAALERLAQSFQEQTGIDIHFQTAVHGRLPPEVETALYRIVQESLTNIVKHARAGSVSIVLTRKESSASVVVEDDGVGFEPSRAREDGLGLVGMRERVGLLGGRLTIESRPGAGTTFVAEVPLT